MKRQNLKLIFAIILTALLSFSALGCSNEPIKVGLMVDLTGRASELGISARNGAEIAADRINQSGGVNGRKIQLLIKDDKGLPDEAVKVDKELINEGITVAIGHIASGTGIAGLKVFNEADKLMISQTISTESLSGMDDNFIRIIGSNKKQGEVLAQAALDNKHQKGVAMFYELNNKAYTMEVCKYFRQKYEANGGRIVFEDSFTSKPNMDFDEIARKVIKSGADGAIIVAGGMDLAIITQKIRKEKPDMTIYAGMWAMTGDLITNGGKAVEGVYLPGVYDSENTRPEFISFKSDYYKRYGVEPTFSSVYTYEALMMLSEALKKSNKHDTKSLKKTLLEIGSYNGLQDDFKIDSFGDTDRGYFLFKVTNSAFKREK